MMSRVGTIVAICVALGAGSWLSAQTINIMTDVTWKATNPKPPTGWNTDLSFDDSAWQFAVKDGAHPNNNHIWFESINSADAPAYAWFRKVFTLDQPATLAEGIFTLDDNGQVYVNGHKIIDDNGTGASSFDLMVDPSFFNVGQNLIAVHGADVLTPFHTIGVNLNIEVPEPATLMLFPLAAPLLLRRR